jgi:excisionase family DNA binding protein
MSKLKSRLPQLFSVEEIAERFGVSTKTVRRWIASGELRAHRLGRQIRIAEEDAIAFMATRRR